MARCWIYFKVGSRGCTDRLDEGVKIKQDSKVFWSEQLEEWNCHFLKGESYGRTRNLVIDISTFSWQLDIQERYHIRVQRRGIG